MNPSILILGLLKSECTCLVLFLHDDRSHKMESIFKKFNSNLQL